MIEIYLSNKLIEGIFDVVSPTAQLINVGYPKVLSVPVDISFLCFSIVRCSW